MYLGFPKKENYDGKEEEDKDSEPMMHATGEEDLISIDDHLGVVSREQLEIKIQELFSAPYYDFCNGKNIISDS